MVPFCCCCNYVTVRQIGMRIFNFVVLSVITAPRNAPPAHISKTHISRTRIELMLKRPFKEKGRSPLLRGGEAQLPLQNLKNLLNGAPSLHRGMRLSNVVQSKSNFARDV